MHKLGFFKLTISKKQTHHQLRIYHSRSADFQIFYQVVTTNYSFRKKLWKNLLIWCYISKLFQNCRISFMKFKIVWLFYRDIWKWKRYNFGFDDIASLEQKNKLSYSEISFIIKFFVEEEKRIQIYRYTYVEENLRVLLRKSDLYCIICSFKSNVLFMLYIICVSGVI